jgi:ATP-dependent RNA helicase RhlB
VLELAYEHMNDPELIRIEPERVTADRVRQVIYYPAMEEKASLLVHFLRKTDATRTMVFVNTKRLAERLERVLRANGIVASAMSGDVPQRKRMRMLREFHEGKLAVLVATDVAARGLHIPDVSHVFNYDLPQDAQDYVHRIGRTARAGAAGDAVSFGCEQYVESLPEIEAFIGQRIPVGSFDPAELPRLRSGYYAPRQDDDEEDGPPPPQRHSHSHSQGRHDHRGGRSHAQPPVKVTVAPAQPAAAAADDAAPARKRRRRRRRHGGGPGGGPQPTPAG